MSLVDRELEYGSPSAEAARDQLIRLPAIPKTHPHDQSVFGARPCAPTPTLVQPAPALTGLITRAASDSAFLALLQPTSQPTATHIVSPPSSARGTSREQAKAGKPAPKPAAPSGNKKLKAGDVPPPSPEESLIAACSQDLMLYIRESVAARNDYENWKKDTSVVALPVAPGPLSSVDTRLYSHLLNLVPDGGVTIHTMLHAMFEQVGVQATNAAATKTPAPADLDAFFAGEQLSEVESFMASALERVTFNSHAAPEWKQGQTTAIPSSGNALGVAPVDGAAYISSGDSLGERRAECCLALGIPLVPDSTSLAAEALIASFLPLPGVGGRGMPRVSSEEQARQVMDSTQLLARGSNAELSEEVFQRALLLLELEEMLLLPPPDFKHTLHAAVDASQEDEVDVLIYPLPGKSASGALPVSRTNQVKEKRPGASLYHTSHARQSNRTIESAIAAQLRSLHASAVDNGSADGLGSGIGLPDPTHNEREEWQLESRTTLEEFDQRVLPQKLAEAMFRPSGRTQTLVRYRPLFDELLVIVNTPTPIKRQNQQTWNEYFTPNLTLDAWFKASTSIQRSTPTTLYQYADECESGKLSIRHLNYYPPDRGLFGSEVVQCGDRVSARVWVEKDGTFMVLEKVSRPRRPPPANQAPPQLTEIIIPNDEAEQPTSRPTSREGTSRSKSGTARKGSAKKKDSASAAAAAPAATNAAGKDAAKAKPPGKAPASTSAKKKAQLEEQAHLDELAQSLQDAQAELDAAKQFEASQVEIAATQDASDEVVVYSASFGDATRLSVSGRRCDGSQRVTYLTKTGLVLELRSQDEVYMSYPKSALDGGQVHTIVPAAEKEEFTAAPPAAIGSASLLSSAESYRVVSPEGIIYRVNHDGSEWLLLPNGEVASRSSGGAWLWTDLAGVQTQRDSDGSVQQVGSIQVVQQYDAESGATVWTRQDLTMFISYANGSSLAQHAEGSRIYTDVLSTDSTASTITHGDSSDSKPRKQVVVEAPRFPPLHFTHSLRTDLRDSAESFAAGGFDGPLSSGVQRRNVVDVTVEFPCEGARIEKTARFDTIVFKRRAASEEVRILENGHVLYLSRDLPRDTLTDEFNRGCIDLDAIPKHVYHFNLNIDQGGGVLVFKDVEDSLYTVDCVGGGSMVLGRERNLAGGEEDSIPATYYPLPANPIPPRIFVVRADGSGFELLDDASLQLDLLDAARDPRVSELASESLGVGDSHSRKFLLTVPQPKWYVRHPIIPNVVRAAPSGLAAGSTVAALTDTDPLVVLKGPNVSSSPVQPTPTLVYRHLLTTSPVTPSDKVVCQSVRQAWCDSKESLEQQELMYALDAARQVERDEQELEEEARVEEEIRRVRAGVGRAVQAHLTAIADASGRVSSTAGDRSSLSSASRSRSRPGTANAHRTATSAALLPKPVHEAEEGQAVVAGMLSTLTAPPKTFFNPKNESAAVSKEKRARPTSATPAGAPIVAEFGSFFTHPSFRRDYLIANLLQRATDLCSPVLPGARQEELDEPTQQDKDQLWANLSADEKSLYTEQFHTRVSHLVSNFNAFLDRASAFLSQPYSVAARTIVLQDSPYVDLLDPRKCSDAFPELVESLANIIGYSRENEALVLTTNDDETFKENLTAVRQKLQELIQATGDNSNEEEKAEQSSQEEKEFNDSNPNATSLEARGESDLSGVDGIDYDGMMAALSEKERAAFMATPAYQQYLSREQRLKNIKSTYSTQQHASHGASFQYVSPFAPKEPHYPPQPGRTSMPANPRPTTTDVTGALRKSSNSIHLPAAMGAVAPAELNQRHLLNELQSGQPRPAPKTSSTVKQTWHTSTAPFANFILQPPSLELGPLRKGCTYRATLALTNTGNMTGRFQVIQPDERPDNVHIKVHYRPGLVAPGLQRRLEVELFAGTVGELREEIVIKTEQHIFRLPLSALIMSDSDYSRAKDGGVGSSNPLLTNTFTAPVVLAPALNAIYDRSFPSSPMTKATGGPFNLTSTFNKTNGAGPPFSKSVTSFASPPAPRGSFGAPGEVRLVGPAATPHIAYAMQQTATRRPFVPSETEI